MLLKIGSKGAAVEAWQKFIGVTPDGDFGPATERATRFFQAANGLREDGLVGANTLSVAKSKGFILPPEAGAEQSSPAGRTILISAGHSTLQPVDPGAVGNNFVEAEEALKMRDRIAGLLRAKGLTVTEDGADGENSPLKKALALARGASVAVEIHFNASLNPTASGIEVLCKPDKRKQAQLLAQAIAAALGIPLRGGDGGYKSDSSGQHHRLAFCEAGGLIIETAFISNSRDMKSYADNFEPLCRAIADCLANDF